MISYMEKTYGQKSSILCTLDTDVKLFISVNIIIMTTKHGINSCAKDSIQLAKATSYAQ